MDTPAGHDRNAEQITYWNGPAGQKWVHRQQMQDIVLGPVSDSLIERARVAAGERVIDIGCGCGSTSIAFAKAVGPRGHVLGVDISAPMLARAREVAPVGTPVEFALADATVHAFQPAGFDLLASRFGVMFFADPVLSFVNMRKALRPGGRVAFACWRTPRDNPWMILPLMAAYKHVPKLPELGPEDPGPFAFANEERVRRILGEAGFSAITLERCDLSLDLSAGKGLDGAVKAAIEIGPVSRALEDQSPEAITAVAASIHEALTPFARDGAVPLGASIWIVTAANA
jgi:ubiquinone/menaquinone biosynthesis C-methylase UbiE